MTETQKIRCCCDGCDGVVEVPVCEVVNRIACPKCGRVYWVRVLISSEETDVEGEE